MSGVRRRTRPLDLQQGVLVHGRAHPSGRTRLPPGSPELRGLPMSREEEAAARAAAAAAAAIDQDQVFARDGDAESEAESDSDGDDAPASAARRNATTPVPGAASFIAARRPPSRTGRPRSYSGESGASIETASRADLVKELNRLRQHCGVLATRLEREMAEGTRPFIEEMTPFSFMYQPHTVTALIAMLACILYVAFIRPSGGDAQQDLALGLMVVVCVFLMYCVVQLRDSMMIRPHPAVWRFMHGVAILYLLLLVFLLCQTHENALKILNFFDPSVGVVRPPKSQPAWDCRVFTPDHPSGSMMGNLYEAVIGDVFMLAHALGWIAKAVLFRDWALCWALCIAWELVEFSLQHMLGNFHECWWDHWILDVFGCNLLGMVIGMAICRWFSMKQYDWTGTGTTTRDKIKRAIAQLGPYDWTDFTWDFFSSGRRFGAFVFLIAFTLVVELNAFFFLRIWWLYPAHKFNNIRLFTWSALAMSSIREFFQYLTDNRQRRVGFNMWLSLGVLTTECAIVFKFTDGLLTMPLPPIVIKCWAVTLAAGALWAFLKFDPWNLFASQRSAARGWSMNIAFALSLLPMVYLAYDRDLGYGRMVNGPPVVN